MTMQKKPTGGNAFFELLKNKGFLPELDEKSLDEKKKTLAQMLKGTDDKALNPLPNDGKPRTTPFGNFGQGWANSRSCADEEVTNTEPTPTSSFRR